MTTNRNWLSKPPLRDLAKRFEAEHVEPNDESAPKDGVSDPGGGSNDANAAQDSREKLEADICAKLNDMARFGWRVDGIFRQAQGWLDRQAAITAREVKERVDFSLITQTANAMFPDYQEQVAELQAEVDELTAERDMWRDKCGRMRDAAHELARIAEVDE